MRDLAIFRSYMGQFFSSSAKKLIKDINNSSLEINDHNVPEEESIGDENEVMSGSRL